MSCVRVVLGKNGRFVVIYINPVNTFIKFRLAWVWVRTLKVALRCLIYIARLPKFLRETLLCKIVTMSLWLQTA